MSTVREFWLTLSTIQSLQYIGAVYWILDHSSYEYCSWVLTFSEYYTKSTIYRGGLLDPWSLYWILHRMKSDLSVDWMVTEWWLNGDRMVTEWWLNGGWLATEWRLNGDGKGGFRSHFSHHSVDWMAGRFQWPFSQLYFWKIKLCRYDIKTSWRHS